jgi:hypothetical protein
MFKKGEGNIADTLKQLQAGMGNAQYPLDAAFIATSNVSFVAGEEVFEGPAVCWVSTEGCIGAGVYVKPYHCLGQPLYHCSKELLQLIVAAKALTQSGS